VIGLLIAFGIFPLASGSCSSGGGGEGDDVAGTAGTSAAGTAGTARGGTAGTATGGVPATGVAGATTSPGGSGGAATGAAGSGGRTTGAAGSAVGTGGRGGAASAGRGGAATAGSGGAASAGRGGAASAGSGGAATAGRGGAASAGRGGAATAGSGGAGSGGAAAAGHGGAAGTATGGVPSTGEGGAGGGAGGAIGADVCARWKADRANLSEGTWTGAVASCTAGDMAPEARENVLRLVNLYRWLADLPPVTLDATRNQKDQACALMMRANNMLSHDPPSTWTCYSDDGADAAGNSNISSGQAVSSVDLYMIDPGNDTTIGHRRWILSNSLGPIGVGGTDKSSCMWTLGGIGKAGKPWMAWPAAGTIPLQAIAGSRGQTVDSTGWTVQSDNINLANAEVTVTVDGAAQPVTVTQLGANYGSRYAIRFNPMGWTTTAGKTYNVSITGTSTAISYAVQVVSCP
jgi:hypothetical protein